ncbi:MAG: hypothetical protein KDB53_08670 [Planctomycetes bacterium]|nr:hypothetical protein [Planctomycetota bacterium]
MNRLTLWIALSLVVPGLAQTPEPPAAADVVADVARPALDQAAIEILERARRAQDPHNVAHLVVGFRGEAGYRLMERKEDGSIGDDLQGRIAQYWMMRDGPEGGHESAYRRELTADVSKKPDVQVATFDGRYFRLDGTRPVSMSSKDYEPDRNRLALERRRIGHIFELFLLQRLQPLPGSLKLRPETERLVFLIGRSQRSGVEVDVVTQVVDLQDQIGRQVTLWIDTKDSRVVRARVVEPGFTEEYQLWGHTALPVHTPDGDRSVFIPLKVQYLENGQVTLEVQAKERDVSLQPFTDREVQKWFSYPE